MIWRTKLLFAKIATTSSFLQKVNKNFTRKKVLRTNPKGAQIADAQESNKETAIAATAVTDGKQKRERKLSFFMQKK